MDQRRAGRTKKTFIPLVLVFLMATAGFSYARSQQKEEPLKNVGKEPSARAGAGENLDTLSKVVLAVDGMSCGGCVFTIKSSLAGFEAISDIVVDVPTGKAEVYFDDSKLRNVEEITAAITASGYPARIEQVLSPEELKKERDLYARSSKLNIASVGGVDILREEFDAELGNARSRYERIYGDGVFSAPQGIELEDSLKAQIASYLVNERIQLYEIQTSGYRLDPEKLDAAFQAFLDQKSMTEDDFKASLEENGYSMEQFMKRFERRLLIQSYLDEKVFDGVSDRIEKKQRYADWMGNATLMAKVVYHDKSIERLVKKAPAGGSCCRSGQKSCGQAAPQTR